MNRWVLITIIYYDITIKMKHITEMYTQRRHVMREGGDQASALRGQDVNCRSRSRRSQTVWGFRL